MRSISRLLLRVFASVVILWAPPSVGQSNNGTTAATPSCAAGVHLIVARGSNEPAGVGRVGVVAGNVTKAVSNSSVAPVVYPATFSGYLASEGAGVAAMASMIAEYAARCPDSKIALLGYSQGGQVVMDVVCGTSSAFFAATPDLSDAFEKNIIAVVTFGDPSHMAGMSWNEGTSNRTGILPRNNIAACEPYSHIIREWCDTGDIYCDSGNDRSVHGTYFANYTTDATNFIVGKFNESKASTGSSSGGPSSTTLPPTISSTGTSTGTTTSAAATSTPSVMTGNRAGSIRAPRLGVVALLFVTAAFGILL